MIRPLLTAALLSLSLTAGMIQARYDISFSVFGKIGEAKVSLETYGEFYHITVDGGLTGAAASMGGHRREVHESFGVIRDGMLEPELYKKQRRSDKRHEDTYYVFYPDGAIDKFRFRQRTVNKTRFDTKEFRIVDDSYIEKSDSMERVDFKAKNDLLSLFFNVRALLKDMPRGSETEEKVAGAKSEDNKISITNPAGKKRQEISELMPDNEDRLVTVIINQDIFQSDRGELYINLDETYLAKEAMLKDVLLFGDVRGVRVWQDGELPTY